MWFGTTGTLPLMRYGYHPWRLLSILTQIVSSSRVEARCSKATTLRSSRFGRSTRAAHRLKKELELSRFHKRDCIIHATSVKGRRQDPVLVIDPHLRATLFARHLSSPLSH